MWRWGGDGGTRSRWPMLGNMCIDMKTGNVNISVSASNIKSKYIEVDCTAHYFMKWLLFYRRWGSNINFEHVLRLSRRRLCFRGYTIYVETTEDSGGFLGFDGRMPNIFYFFFLLLLLCTTCTWLREAKVTRCGPIYWKDSTITAEFNWNFCLYRVDTAFYDRNKNNGTMGDVCWDQCSWMLICCFFHLQFGPWPTILLPNRQRSGDQGLGPRTPRDVRRWVTQ